MPQPPERHSRPPSTLRPRGVRGSSGSAAGGRLALDGRAHRGGARRSGSPTWWSSRGPGDLAVHVFRAELFGREGFTVWNGHWYGGHHTPGLQRAVARRCPGCWGRGCCWWPPAWPAPRCSSGWRAAHFGAERARLGALWLGVGTVTLLATSRLPFALGTALGLAAVLALQRDRPRLAVAFALLSPLASPVAGLFTALAGLAYARGRGRAPALARRGRRSPRSAAGPALGRVPRGRLGALPVHGLPADPDLLRGLPAAAPARRAGAARRGGALRGRRHAGGGGRDADRRHGAAARDAVRRAAAAVRGAGIACGAPARRCWRVAVAGFALLAYWQWTSAIRDIDKALQRPGRRVGLLRAAAPVPRHAARPAPDRDSVHEQPLGERRGRAARAAGARLAAPARHRAQPGLLPRRPQPAHVRELAGGERGALRGVAERQARQELVRASGR